MSHNYIMGELAGALVDGSLEVADRRNLAFVYKEPGFQLSGDVSDESAVAIGKFLGAPYVITGQLVKAGNRYRYRLAGINVEKVTQESSTRLDVRNDRAFQSLLADTRTAPIVTAAADYGVGENAAPQTAGALLDRGILFAMLGDYELAVTDFSDAIQLDGALAPTYVLRGRALYAAVSQVIGLEEGFSRVRFNVADTNISNEQKAVYTRAITDFNQAIRIDPNNKIAYKERGLMYKEQGDYDRAIADYEAALRINPNDATVKGNLERARRMRGR
jgi:tetratricopeptide (TPR) repeat protein